MVFQKKTLRCIECQAPFDFTVDEKEYYQSKGITEEPQICPTCRHAKDKESEHSEHED